AARLEGVCDAGLPLLVLPVPGRDAPVHHHRVAGVDRAADVLGEPAPARDPDAQALPVDPLAGLLVEAARVAGDPEVGQQVVVLGDLLLRVVEHCADHRDVCIEHRLSSEILTSTLDARTGPPTRVLGPAPVVSTECAICGRRTHLWTPR